MERLENGEPPEKRLRTTQISLGAFGFTRNQQPLPRLPPAPTPSPAIDCLFCHRVFKKVVGRICHEKFCDLNPVNVRSREETVLLAEELISIFDWQAWALSVAPAAAILAGGAWIDDDDNDEDDNDEDDNDDADLMEIVDAGDPGEEILAPKEKKKRIRETLKAKIRILDLIPEIRKRLATKRARPQDSIPMNDILFVIQHNSGVRASTIDKWHRREAKLRELYKEKTNRSSKSFGCGLPAAFPTSEREVARLIREKRTSHKIVTKAFVISELRRLAAEEDRALFDLLKVEDDIFYGFMKRERFSFRKPSNTKAMTLEVAQKTVRGYFQWMLKLLKDDFGDGVPHAKAVDPVEGSFPFDCRCNKDEVQLLFSPFIGY